MVLTPWGEGSELRNRMMDSGPRPTPEAATQNQRERLFGAMVAVCAERGYEATRVGEVIALAGVSRRDFYKYFANKEECFVATLEALLEGVWKVVSLSYDGRGSGLRAFVDLIVAQPAAARICFIETYPAGTAAVELMDQALAQVEALYTQAFAARDGAARMPPEIVVAIVGGLRKVVQTHLRRGREEELGALVGELWKWSFGYAAPPKGLRSRARSRRPITPYRSEEPAERIITAAWETMAERGYQETTIGAVVERASTSLSTFYQHFASKEELLSAALDAGQARLYGAVLPAYRRARSWPAAVRAAYEAMFGFFAAEPAFARLAMVGVHAAGVEALERRDRAIEQLLSYLDRGFERSPEVPPIAAEAIGGAVLTLIYAQIETAGPESLAELTPLATYLTLAPFVGAEEACAVANGGG